MDGSDSREQGVEFGTLADDLADADYPLSQATLLDEYGDRELDLEDGSTTLREVLDPEAEQSYEGPDDIRQSVLDMVGDEAVGREGQSDRGGGSLGIDEDEEDVSF